MRTTVSIDDADVAWLLAETGATSPAAAVRQYITQAAIGERLVAATYRLAAGFPPGTSRRLHAENEACWAKMLEDDGYNPDGSKK